MTRLNVPSDFAPMPEPTNDDEVFDAMYGAALDEADVERNETHHVPGCGGELRATECAIVCGKCGVVTRRFPGQSFDLGDAA